MGSRTLNRKSLLALYKTPIFGGEEKEEDEDGEDGEGESKPKPGDRRKPKEGAKSSKDEDEDDEDGEDGEDEDLDGLDPKDRRIIELTREKIKHRKERNAARREKEALQAELDKNNNSGKSEKEQFEALLQAEKDKNDKLTKSVSRNIIRTAIVENDKLTWHDLDVVMGLLDHDLLDIDAEEGVVDGLDDQLKKLAKDKPFLLKKKTGGQGSGEDGSGSTGSNPRGGRKTGQEITDRDRLIAKYNKVLH